MTQNFIQKCFYYYTYLGANVRQLYLQSAGGGGGSNLSFEKIQYLLVTGNYICTCLETHALL